MDSPTSTATSSAAVNSSKTLRSSVINLLRGCGLSGVRIDKEVLRKKLVMPEYLRQAVVRVGAGSRELGPIVVMGCVLLAPFFGGTVLCESEANGHVDAFLNLELIYRLWRISIPVGDNTDHPLINPFGQTARIWNQWLSIRSWSWLGEVIF
ncbi:unnamed protein product [Linum tenue]|uniref:Uncharacterized protein n=1 Tax=Linum tenue TaxID=586396 RepID=A0AAV0GNU2_9ROSI|nr:unnamed protein product [Linum tenue]